MLRPVCGWFETVEWLASAACRSGRAVESDLAEVVERLQGIGKVKRSGYVELLDRRAVVQQLQQLNLGGAQIHDRCLQLRFVLHAQQLDAIEVDLGDIPMP